MEGRTEEEGVEVVRLFLTTDLRRVLLHVQPTVHHAGVASTGHDAELQQPIQYARLPNVEDDDALDLVTTDHQEQLKLGTFDLPVFMQSQYVRSRSFYLFVLVIYSFLLFINN
jgi:hypothetical protein